MESFARLSSIFFSFLLLSGDCPNVMDTKCLNGGFLKAYRGDNRDCGCECPPNTDGQFCQTILKDNYYDAIDPLPCGGNITQSTEIFTPNYGQKNVSRQSCVWNIKVFEI